jgi:bifunctional NMN adenylyltransferase/nudix hydrolase
MNTLATVGVIVGRFQVAELHEGHQHLFDRVRAQHEDVLVVLGTPEFPTPRNPLSYDMRKHMVETSYPGVAVVKLQDHPSDAHWSSELDRIVAAHCGEKRAVLYASRDSFALVYTGAFEVCEVDELPNINGTSCRESIAATEGRSEEFRRGVIYAFKKRLAVTRPMVDVAVLREETGHVLLAGKATDKDDEWRFIGGLVDPTDVSLEMAAKRETGEETSHIEVDDVRYVGSRAISDWRYRGTGESGITTLFRAKYIFGAPRPADDIVRLAWIPYAEVMTKLTDEHRPLGELLMKHLTLT